MKAVAAILLWITFGAALGHAVAPSSPEDDADGWIENGVYTNQVYSFDFKIPAGWQVVPDDKRGNYAAELNRGRNADARVFLMLYRPAKTQGVLPDIIVVAAAKTGLAAGISRKAAMVFFKAEKRPKNSEVIRAASPFLLGGLLVAREDLHVRSDAGEQFMANMLIAVRDRMITFQAYSGTRAGMEEGTDAIVSATEFQPDWINRSLSPQADPPGARVRLAQDSLLALVEKKVPPEIPDSLSETPVNVTIDMHVLVSATGEVEKIWVFEGMPQLSWPAVEAVSKWKFHPYMVNGKAVPIESTLTVAFQ
jgi:hypothetical protein